LRILSQDKPWIGNLVARDFLHLGQIPNPDQSPVLGMEGEQGRLKFISREIKG
jgi:hypothetical protein